MLHTRLASRHAPQASSTRTAALRGRVMHGPAKMLARAIFVALSAAVCNAALHTVVWLSRCYDVVHVYVCSASPRSRPA
jgi:hypothetical protein